MTTYKHIVQVHPVENGEVNLHKVELERYAGAHCPDSCYQCEYHGKCLDEAEFDQ